MANNERSKGEAIDNAAFDHAEAYSPPQQTWGNASRGFDDDLLDREVERSDARRADSRSRPNTGENELPSEGAKRGYLCNYSKKLYKNRNNAPVWVDE